MLVERRPTMRCGAGTAPACRGAFRTTVDNGHVRRCGAGCVCRFLSRILRVCTVRRRLRMPANSIQSYSTIAACCQSNSAALKRPVQRQSKEDLHGNRPCDRLRRSACRTPDQPRPWRRLRLQAGAVRAAAASRRPARRPVPSGSFWSAPRPATTRPSGRSTTRPASSRPPISSCRWSTTRMISAGSRRPTRSPTSMRWAAGRSWRWRSSACRSTRYRRDGARDPEGRRRRLRHGRNPGRRRPFDRCAGADLRPGRDRHLPAGGCPAQLRRKAGRCPDPDQGARRRHLFRRDQEAGASVRAATPR